MDSLQVEAIRQIMTASANAPAQATGAVADPAAAQRFQALMEAPVAVQNAENATPAQMRIPFADRLHHAFNAQQSQYQEHLEKITGVLEQSRVGEVTQTDLMALQFEIHSLTFQQNVVSKVIESASSAIQTLIKNS